MGVFSECVLVLDMKQLPIKKKNHLKTVIKTHDGIISYLVNQQCTHVVASDINAVSTCRLKAIHKYKIPLVNVSYITSSIEAGQLLDTSCYMLCQPNAERNTEPTPIQKVHDVEHTEDQMIDFSEDLQAALIECRQNNKSPQDGIQDDSENFRMFSAHDNNIPYFAQDFEVAKYLVLEKDGSGVQELMVIELQVSQKNAPLPFRISSHSGQRGRFQTQQQQFVFTSTAETAEKAYEWCIKKQVEQDFIVQPSWLPAAQPLASEKLQQLIFEEALYVTHISDDVRVFVEAIWAEAQSCLQDQEIDTTSINLNDVTRAEGVLLQLKKAIDDKATTATLTALMSEFCTILQLKPESDMTITKKKIAQKQDLCQVIRDVLNASEATSWAPQTTSLAKFHALRCHIECVDRNSDEFMRIKMQLLNSNQSGSPVTIQQIFCVARLSESRQFQSQLDNIRPLYHGSAMSNFVGILSRGLLPPNIVVESYGGERTDVGNLGSGIYFSDSIGTSIKYSKPSTTDGSRLVAICDVALGKCKQYYKKDTTLSAPPEGYSSVHGVHKTAGTFSEFDDDEFVVYRTDQVKMKYVIQFCVGDEQLKPFSPPAIIAENNLPPTFTSTIPSTDDLQDAQDPLKSVKAGLQDSAGNVIPLQEVHIKAKLVDLVGEVTVFQSYTNSNAFPIEAKYVFPLDDTAAVCGFEAFINGKHIIGQVKEKQQAHREYRQAIKQGHGAYLMDQSAADVFTISIGNLPPNANVVIKITYITELSVDQEYICFLLPGNVATQQWDKALQEETQESVERICVKELQLPGVFSVELSIEMPYEIKDIKSPTHEIKIKRTDCKAVVSLEQDSSLGTGFQLLILLAEIHVPRMWVENNPEKDSQACMVAFYPEFDVGTLSDCEAIICLDCSYSMQGLTFQHARKIALLILQHLPTSCTFNVITFGTGYKELFPCSQQRNSEDAVDAARHFVLSAQKPMGNTDLWRPMRSLSLLAPSKRLRNILLISDGHIQNEDLTLKTVQQNVKYNRIFTCGVGSTANRHMLRALALYGGGAYEYFDEKNKFGWTKKVMSQVDRVTQPECRSISVQWQQFNHNKLDPLQAPAQIHSIFSGSRLLVYGFVPHCTQATLSALINNQQVNTMVSTTELQKTKGKTLHRLTARALIGDYENGSLHADQSEHEMKKSIQKSCIIELSKEYSIVTQFTSFVAVEERNDQETEGVQGPSVQELAAKEIVDILPYIDWEEQMHRRQVKKKRLRTRAKQSQRPDYNIGYAEFDECSDGFSVGSAQAELCEELADSPDCDLVLMDNDTACNSDDLAVVAENESKRGSFTSSTESSDTSSASSELIYEGISGPPPRPHSPALNFSSDFQIPRRANTSCFWGSKAKNIPFSFSTESTDDPFCDAFGAEACSSVNFGSLPLAAFELDSSRPMASAPCPVGLGSPPMSSAPRPVSFATQPLLGPAPRPVGFQAPPIKRLARRPVGFATRPPMVSAPPPAPPPVGFGSPPMPLAPRPVGFGAQPLKGSAPPVGFHVPPFKGLAPPPFGFATRPPMVSTRLRRLAAAPSNDLGSPSLLTAAPLGGFDTRPPLVDTLPEFGLAAVRCPPKASHVVHSHSALIAEVLMDEIQTVEESVRNERKKSEDEQEANYNKSCESDIITECAANMQYIKQHPWKMQAVFQSEQQQQQQFTFIERLSRREDVPEEELQMSKKEGLSFALGKTAGSVALREQSSSQLFSSFPSNYVAKGSAEKDVFLNCGLPFVKRLAVCRGKCFEGTKLRVEKKIAKKMFRGKSSIIPWKQLFELQNERGFWLITSDLGTLLDINLIYLIDFLGKKGINSLGHRASEEVVSLIITLLVLQLVHCTQQLKGIKLKSLFRMEEPLDSGTPHWALESVKKAVAWARATERQYPGICSRLELGKDWESATRQLLQIDPLNQGSPLQQIFK